MTVSSIVKSIQNIMRKDAGLDGDAQRLSQLVWLFFLKIIDDQDQQLELVQSNYISPIPLKYQWRAWAADPEGVTGEDLLQFINADLFISLKELNTSGENSSRRLIVRGVFQDAYNYMKSGHLLRQVVNEINLIDFNNLADRQHFGDIYEQLLNDLQSAGNSGEFYTPRAITSFMVQQIDPKPGEVVFDPACGTGGFLTCTIRHQRENYIKTIQDEELLQKSLRAVEKKQLPHLLATTNMLLHGIEDPKFVRHDNTLARPYVSYGDSDRVDIILTNPPFGGKEEDGIESNFPSHLQTKETADLFLALIIRLLKKDGRAAVVLPDGFMFGEGVKSRIKEQLLSECNLHTIVRLPDSVFKPYASVGTNLLFFEKGTPTSDIWFYEMLVPQGQKAYSKTRPILLNHFDEVSNWWGGEARSNREVNERAWKISRSEVELNDFNLDFKNPHSTIFKVGSTKELLSEIGATESQRMDLTSNLYLNMKFLLGELEPSEVENLFHHLSDSPQLLSLKSMILDGVLQGNLKVTDTGEFEKSELADEWQEIEISEIMPKRSSITPKTDFTYIDVTSIDKERGVIANPKQVDWKEAPSRARKRVERGDVLYSCVRPYLLNIAVVSEDFSPKPIASTAFAILNGGEKVLGDYLWLVLRSNYFTNMVKEKMRGQAYPAINDSDLKALRIQVPTLEIQNKTMEWAKDLISRFDDLIACNQRLKVLNLNYLVAQANSLGLDFQESEKA